MSGHNEIDAHLEAISGYIDLGMYEDALEQLENLAPEWKSHPKTMRILMDLLVETKRWFQGALLGQALCQSIPTESEFFFKAAYCLHELKQTEAAKNTLLSAPGSAKETALYYYNLACYETQLGHLSEARLLLTQCYILDDTFRVDAQVDPDLSPLRE